MEQKKAEEQKNLEICEEEQKQTEESEEGKNCFEEIKKLIEEWGIPDPNWVE